MLTDLGSSNGTEIDGVAITGTDRVEVRKGSRIRFGDVEVTVDLPVRERPR